jgi:hypothetical protein
MLAETARLAVDLSLKGNFSSALAANQRALSGFNAKITDTQGRAYKAGQQIGTGIRRGVFLAVGAVGALIPLLISMAKEGQDAANVQAIFAKAISNSGRVTTANVAALKAQEAALLSLGGVDDELIKTEQTRLIQMGLTGDQVLKLTPLILDFSKAQGIDLLTATKLAGKAVEGNTTALSRYGVLIDKAKAKTDPFAATVDALNSKFGGTTQVLSGSLNTRLAVLREKMANIREEAGMKLLPVFTRIVDVVGSKLVPAFGKLIDAILPRAIAGLNEFANFLDRGGGADSINGVVNSIKALIPALTAGAQITGRVIGTAVSLFRSLPPEIQGLAVAGLAVNKLTGGLVTNIAGGLIGTVVGKLFNSLKSAVVNVNGAVVNVVGAGIPTGPGGAIPVAAGAAASKGTSVLATAGKAVVGVTVLGIVAEAAVPIGQAFAASLPDWLKGPGGQGKSEAQTRIEAARALQAQKDIEAAVNKTGADAHIDHNDEIAAVRRNTSVLSSARDRIESAKVAQVSASRRTTAAVWSVRDRIEAAKLAQIAASARTTAAVRDARAAIVARLLGIQAALYQLPGAINNHLGGAPGAYRPPAVNITVKSSAADAVKATNTLKNAGNVYLAAKPS